MKRIALLLLVLAAIPGWALGDEEIAVAAAADLNPAVKELAVRYQQRSGTKASISFGASGTFYSQIQSGAPYDVFFSADAEYPTKLAEAGLIEKSSLRTYAVGHLVLWVPNTVNLDLSQLKMDVLVQSAVRKVAIANPDHAPYGRAAVAALQHFGLKGVVGEKLVFGENVSQAAQFVQSGNAQAGLIPMSLAMSPAMKASGRYWELPADSYPQIQQAVGVLSASKHKQAAQAFVDFVTSPEGAAVLRQYGFALPASQ